MALFESVERCRKVIEFSLERLPSGAARGSHGSQIPSYVTYEVQVEVAAEDDACICHKPKYWECDESEEGTGYDAIPKEGGYGTGMDKRSDEHGSENGRHHVEGGALVNRLAVELGHRRADECLEAIAEKGDWSSHRNKWNQGQGQHQLGEVKS